MQHQRRWAPFPTPCRWSLLQRLQCPLRPQLERLWQRQLRAQLLVQQPERQAARLGARQVPPEGVQEGQAPLGVGQVLL